MAREEYPVAVGGPIGLCVEVCNQAGDDGRQHPAFNLIYSCGKSGEKRRDGK
jgi:hypothetical protein